MWTRNLAREELNANEALLEQGFVSKVRLLNLRRGEADYAAREQSNLAELAKARQRVAELRLRAAGLRHTFMQEAADEHKRTSAQVFELRERLRTWEDQEFRQKVTAPVAGEIVDLKVGGSGSVIGPRDAILDIVPENADLIIEAQVRPEDINHVQPGALADVRLQATHHARSDRRCELCVGRSAGRQNHAQPLLRGAGKGQCPESPRSRRLASDGWDAGGGLHQDCDVQSTGVPDRADHVLPGARFA
ncbi:MAG: HlyD family efflux transporter periplasmic adaptor subunit [Betaproteobacteria bacterium]|nr:HlyD family efflux transporter periplasmic adaptor subunit [Betaproteobacteria bacterium]